MMQVPILRNGQEQSSLDTRTLLDYRGTPLAEVHQAPALLIPRVVSALRAAAPGPAENPAARWDAVERAGELLTGADLDGLTPAEHARLVTRATGAPLHDVERAVAELAAGMRSIRAALVRQAPGGNLAVFSTRRVVLPDGRSHAWVPVGRVLGFVAPSNHPAVHLSWVLALAMGWSVALRPGADDPLTPRRVALALQAAGFPMERFALLPGGHGLVNPLVQACDRTVAYGGDSLASLLRHDGRVLFNGPGNSKVLVDAATAGAAASEVAEFLLEAMAHDGGRKCTCASAVVLRGKAPGLLDELDGKLAAIPLLDPLDPAARVPAWKDPAGALRTPAEAVEADGLTFLRPALVRCPDPSTSPFGLELPTPWATAVELPADADPLPVLHGSLAVTLLSGDEPLREACLLEPSIQKVYTGPVPPWHSEPGAPHHGLLSEFLFTCKAFQEVPVPWG